jgi:Rrf2 family nitric oxide-sensitive transcriptional repressor
MTGNRRRPVSYLRMTKVITRLAELGVIGARCGRGGGLATTELGRTARVGWLVRRREAHTRFVEPSSHGHPTQTGP